MTQSQETPMSFSMPQLDVVGEEPATVVIDGEEYKIGRTKMKHLADLAARLRSERLQSLLAVNARTTIPGLIFANALGKCASSDPTEDDFWQYVNTERGSVYLLWRAMSDHMPMLTEETVWGLVEKQPSLISVLKTMSGLVSPGDLDVGLAEEPEGSDPPLPAFSSPPQTGSENAPSSAKPSNGDSPTFSTSPGGSTPES